MFSDQVTIEAVSFCRWGFGVAALAASVAWSGCTLIDLSGLQSHSTSSGAGGVGGAAVTGASSTGVSGSTGGAGGAPVAMIQRLYVFGGRFIPETPTNSIYVTTINADGSLGAFDQAVQTMGQSREEFSLAVTDSHIFVIGGLGFDTNNAPADNDTSIVGSLGSDGIIGGWSIAAAKLPAKLARSGLARLDNHIYIVAGRPELSSVQSNLVLRADEQAGTIDSFVTAATLPAATDSVGTTIVDGNLIVTGGSNSPSKTFMAPISTDGTLGTFTSGPTLNVSRESHCMVSGMVGGMPRMYIAGGNDSPVLDSVEMATSQNGSLSGWQLSTLKLNMGRRNLACALVGNWLYVMGGVLDSQDASTDITRFDLDPQSGLPVAMHTEVPLPEGRAFHQVAVIELPAP